MDIGDDSEGGGCGDGCDADASSEADVDCSDDAQPMLYEA